MKLIFIVLISILSCSQIKAKTIKATFDIEIPANIKRPLELEIDIVRNPVKSDSLIPEDDKFPDAFTPSSYDGFNEDSLKDHELEKVLNAHDREEDYVEDELKAEQEVINEKMLTDQNSIRSGNHEVRIVDNNDNDQNQKVNLKRTKATKPKTHFEVNKKILLYFDFASLALMFLLIACGLYMAKLIFNHSQRSTVSIQSGRLPYRYHKLGTKDLKLYDDDDDPIDITPKKYSVMKIPVYKNYGDRIEKQPLI